MLIIIPNNLPFFLSSFQKSQHKSRKYSFFCIYKNTKISVADPERFEADLDPDPDPTFQADADPDPAPNIF